MAKERTSEGKMMMTLGRMILGSFMAILFLICEIHSDVLVDKMTWVDWCFFLFFVVIVILGWLVSETWD